MVEAMLYRRRVGYYGGDSTSKFGKLEFRIQNLITGLMRQISQNISTFGT